MTQAVLFTALVPAAVLAVLAALALSDRLPHRVRRRAERALALLLLPGVALFWAWNALSSFLDGKGWAAAGFAIAAACMAVQCFVTVRSGKVPWSRERPQ